MMHTDMFCECELTQPVSPLLLPVRAGGGGAMGLPLSDNNKSSCIYKTRQSLSKRGFTERGALQDCLGFEPAREVL